MQSDFWNLANQQCCSYTSQSKDSKIKKDVEDAGRVMLMLMEKVEPEDGSFTLQHPDRWSVNAGKFYYLMFSASHEELSTVSSDCLSSACKF